MVPPLFGQRAVVFGLGKSGVAAARLLIREGARVIAVDERPLAELGPEAAALAQSGAQLACGAESTRLLQGAELVVVSPGVPLSRPELRSAREAGTRVWAEVELAFRLLRPSGPFIGVTGTNGKSTTTALTGELFAQAGGRVFTGGNLGRPLSESALSAERFSAHVVELSSFQLEGIETMRLSGAALLNLTPDHLDRYPNHRAYGLAKARIFANQRSGDFAVVNADDDVALQLGLTAQVPVFGFSLKAQPRAGRLAGMAAAHSDGFSLNLSGVQGERFTLLNRALRGAHNLENAMAAALLARLSGVDAASIQRGLDRYPGLPHRMESVRTLDGVEWINDSKATNVDSARVALRSFAKNVWLIAGGKGKGAPYAPLVAESDGRLKGVLTVGQDGPAVEAAYSGTIPAYPCGTLESAVARARELAKEGDVVLLSPACASYDQFKNFEERGEVFKRLVRSL